LRTGISCILQVCYWRLSSHRRLNIQAKRKLQVNGLHSCFVTRYELWLSVVTPG